MGNYFCGEDPEVKARKLRIATEVAAYRRDLTDLNLTIDQFLDRLSNFIYLYQCNQNDEYTVDINHWIGNDQCILCGESLQISWYNISKGKETLTFELMSLHYLSRHNYFNLYLCGYNGPNLRAVAHFLRLEPGKSYYMEKEKFRKWESYYNNGDGIHIASYDVTDIPPQDSFKPNIKVNVWINRSDLKKQKRYLIEKYLPHYIGDSDDYVLAELRSHDIKTLLDEPLLYIGTNLDPQCCIIPYGKNFFGYYMDGFGGGHYKKCKYWPTYIVQSQRTTK